MLIRHRFFPAFFAAALIVAATSPADADWNSGLAAFKAGDLETARGEFQALAESRPEWYGGHLMLGQTLLRQGRPGEALLHLGRALDLQPGDVATSLALAQAAVFEQRWTKLDGALGALDPSQLEGAQRASFYRLRGQGSVARERYTDAVEDLEKAAGLAPGDAKLRAQLAGAAMQEKRYDVAVRHLEEARRLDPDDPKILASVTRARFAAAGELEGDAKGAACRAALDDGRRLAASSPDAATLALVGQIELCAGENERARDLLVRAAAADAATWQIAYHLARAHTALQDWRSAERTLQPLLEQQLEPKAEHLVASLMGFTYEGQQRFEKAIEQYTRTGEGEKVTRARKSLEIQRRNAELERIQREIDAIEEASDELDQEQKELGRGLL